MDFPNRQYDPQIGRFLSIDLLADDEQEEWSPYAAMGNNPAMMVDPLGLKDYSPQSIQGNPTMREYPGTEYKGPLFFTEKNSPMFVDGAMLMNYFVTGSFTAITGEQSNQGNGQIEGNDLTGKEKGSNITAGTTEAELKSEGKFIDANDGKSIKYHWYTQSDPNDINTLTRNDGMTLNSADNSSDNKSNDNSALWWARGLIYGGGALAAPLPKSWIGKFVATNASKSTSILSYTLGKWEKPINFMGKRRLYTHTLNGSARTASTWGRFLGR